MGITTTDSQSTPTSLWHPQVRATSIGSLVLILLSAFEAMAVTTVMPTVALDLDGEALYSVAFSATLAASVVAMVVAGRWSDKRGPTGPLLTAVAFFLAGLVVAGTATTMPVLIVGRFLQGLGSGAITVTLYVVVARRYPAELHPKVFGMYAAAWVIPSMVGPFLAGVINDLASWHWVFLGVAVLVLPGLALLGPSLAAVRGPAPSTGDEPAQQHDRANVPFWVSLVLSVIVAAGLVGAGSLAELGPGATTWAAAAVALLVVLTAARWLLPTGTLRARRGLPSTILMRGTITAAYFGTEVYLPKMLQGQYGLSASMAGLVLTVGALSWASGSAIQARLGTRADSRTLLIAGSIVVVVGIFVQLLTALLSWGPAGALSGWLIAGLGMGLAFPRISTLVLGYSNPGNQGFNSSALSIADAIGGSAATAVTGIVFVSVGVGLTSFAACFALCAFIALLNVWIAYRAGAVRTPG